MSNLGVINVQSIDTRIKQPKALRNILIIIAVLILLVKILKRKNTNGLSLL